jgi:hypothetical protein
MKYPQALDVLSDMHRSLVALVSSDLMSPTSRPNSLTAQPPRGSIGMIQLPLPSPSTKSLDPTLLLLIATYLSHALIALSRYFGSTSPKNTQHEPLVLYSQALHDSPSLLRWIPLCTSLPAKQCDVLLTRAYTALTSISSQASGAAEAIFRIRTYALMCLLRTSGSTIGSKTFWDQVVKSASSFARSANSKDKEEERRLCRIVTSAFSELLAFVEERENKNDFLHGTPFISFCDAWISYSKSVSEYQYVFQGVTQSPQADDVAALNRVIDLVQSSPSTSFADADEENLLNALSKLNLHDDGRSNKQEQEDLSGSSSQKDKGKYEPTKVAHITKLCASFSRATSLLSSLGQRNGALPCVASELIVV